MSGDDDEAVEEASRTLLPILAIVAICCAAVVAIASAPIGRPTTASGRVVALGLGYSSKGAPRPWAKVDLPDGRVTVDTYLVLACAVGDTLTVRRQRHVWGSRYSPNETRCRPADRTS